MIKTYLVGDGFRLLTTQQRVDTDVSVKRTTGDDGRVSWTPLYIITPLVTRGQLENNLQCKHQIDVTLNHDDTNADTANE